VRSRKPSATEIYRNEGDQRSRGSSERRFVSHNSIVLCRCRRDNADFRSRHNNARCHSANRSQLARLRQPEGQAETGRFCGSWSGNRSSRQAIMLIASFETIFTSIHVLPSAKTRSAATAVSGFSAIRAAASNGRNSRKECVARTACSYHPSAHLPRANARGRAGLADRSWRIRRRAEGDDCRSGRSQVSTLDRSRAPGDQWPPGSVRSQESTHDVSRPDPERPT